MSLGQIYIFIHYSSLFLKIKNSVLATEKSTLKSAFQQAILTKGAEKGHYGSCWTRTSDRTVMSR